jgi:hypothetical protein
LIQKNPSLPSTGIEITISIALGESLLLLLQPFWEMPPKPDAVEVTAQA